MAPMTLPRVLDHSDYTFKVFPAFWPSVPTAKGGTGRIPGKLSH